MNTTLTITKPYSRLLWRCCFVLLLCPLLMLSSCGSDDDEERITDSNTNCNSTQLYPEASRLEFPRLATLNSLVIVHRADGDVNYCVEWDYELKSQRWSCYTLNRQQLEGRTSRYSGNPHYPLDPDLPLHYYLDRPSEDYEIGDYYWGSGFDHGHICPSADRLTSRLANYQTFFLTNMQPQYNKFNAGLWADMENQVRVWARNSGTQMMYICKGGTIDKPADVLSYVKNRLLVPRYFYMALLLKNAQGYRALAFWAKNENVDRSGDDLAKYVISIDELERLTGIDFFCNLPDDVEKSVEGTVGYNAWGL